MPHPLPAALWWAAALMFLLGMFVAGVWWYRRRHRPTAAAAPKRPAHEIAFDELEQLIAAQLPEQGEMKLFYQHISGILRRYIENRFAIHAPGQTTEEFLTNQRTNNILAPAHQQLLGRFLHHCDLVKFAEFQPASDDLQATFNAGRDFIMETREQATPGSPVSQPTPATA
jgi:hypothetical protein